MPPPRPAHRPDGNDVHLWLWQLETSPADFEAFWQSLSPDERQRADAFRFEKHRQRFVIARGRVRAILAQYLGVGPAQVAIDYGPAGKPRSMTQPAAWHLDFNLSHSEASAALAISAGIELGVDIEHVRPMEEDIARHIFSAPEQAQFAALPQADRNAALFKGWTCKEACLKALGTGLQTPPSHFEFDLSKGEPTSLLRVGGSALEAFSWQLSSFRVSGTCIGAVAARAREWSLIPMSRMEEP
ncbi:4'-phosphopantetheinyl transferase [Labrys miyagiensis]